MSLLQVAWGLTLVARVCQKTFEYIIRVHIHVLLHAFATKLLGGHPIRARSSGPDSCGTGMPKCIWLHHHRSHTCASTCLCYKVAWGHSVRGPKFGARSSGPDSCGTGMPKKHLITSSGFTYMCFYVHAFATKLPGGTPFRAWSSGPDSWNKDTLDWNPCLRPFAALGWSAKPYHLTIISPYTVILMYYHPPSKRVVVHKYHASDLSASCLHWLGIRGSRLHDCPWFVRHAKSSAHLFEFPEFQPCVFSLRWTLWVNPLRTGFCRLQVWKHVTVQCSQRCMFEPPGGTYPGNGEASTASTQK